MRYLRVCIEIGMMGEYMDGMCIERAQAQVQMVALVD